MNKNKGFTLIELFIIMAIIGILASIILPHLMTAMNSTKPTRQVQVNAGPGWVGTSIGLLTMSSPILFVLRRKYKKIVTEKSDRIFNNKVRNIISLFETGMTTFVGLSCFFWALYLVFTAICIIVGEFDLSNVILGTIGVSFLLFGFSFFRNTDYYEEIAENKIGRFFERRRAR